MLSLSSPHDHWGWILKHLERIGTQAKIPGFVGRTKALLDQRRAALFIAPEGFVILRPMRIAVNNVRAVQVWAAFSDSGNAIARYWGEIKQLARDIHANHIEFHTSRRGFDRLAPRLGFVQEGKEGELTHWRAAI